MNNVVDKIKNVSPKQRNLAVALGVVVILIVVLLFAQLATPVRSVANFCKVHAEEKARLATLPGDTYPTPVFDESTNDASEIVKSFGKLERVAPDDIKSDVKTLQSTYQTIHDDPAKALSAAFGGISAENSVKEWTKRHCRANLEGSLNR